LHAVPPFISDSGLIISEFRRGTACLAPSTTQTPTDQSGESFAISARIDGANQANLIRQIKRIQHQPAEQSQTKTKALITACHFDMTALTPSIRRLQNTA
jgi:hypothetical protein